MTTEALYLRKEIAALPAVLTANTLYAVRRGVGFDLYFTDSTGSIAHKVNNTDDPLKSPAFSHADGVLTGISYADGTTKVFNRVDGVLTHVDKVRGSATTRKTFSYAGGALASITETTL